MLERYRRVRRFSEALCEPLDPEDMVVQSMPDASPAKWHLAHTTWFFETFVLGAFDPAYEVFHPSFAYLFNSYYNAVGERHPRPRRGMLTRPRVAEILAYRRHVDDAMSGLLSRGAGSRASEVTQIGLHHEQQHQELLLTDVKHLLSCSVLEPVYRPAAAPEAAQTSAEWVGFGEGVRTIGHRGDGFAFDNEGPRHRVWLDAFEVADRPVSNGDFVAFIEDGGYERPDLWMDLGWTTARARGWGSPKYWRRDDGRWTRFTLGGRRDVALAAPVTHVSWFEADAYARWAGARLATEAEWEVACDEGAGPRGGFVDDGHLEPAPPPAAAGLRAMLGDVWEWTASAYAPYPGFHAAEGAIGEYNGKFMSQQYVLRGGSCATSSDHIRPTYRNFFPPEARWQFSGLRLARSWPR